MMERFKIWLSAKKISFWLTFLFSRVLNWVWSSFKKYETVIPPAASLEDAVDRVGDLVYSPDIFNIGSFKVKHGWMRTAEWVQEQLNEGVIPQTDCDEFALYALAVLEGAFNIFRPKLLTIRWVNQDGELEGHNTCIFNYLDSNMGMQFGTLCNWGLSKGFKNVHEAADSFAVATNSELLAYTVSTKDLKILKYVRA